MYIREAIGYWVAQFLGGIVGALLPLWAFLSGSPAYSRTGVGLGTDGFGHQSLIGLNTASAFGADIVMTFLFVLEVLGATSRHGSR